jgi:hypothetical protein
VVPEVLYISRQINSQALEESPSSLVAFASWKCKEQTFLLTLPLYIPKLAIDLTTEHSCNRRTPPLGKLEIILFS